MLSPASPDARASLRPQVSRTLAATALALLLGLQPISTDVYLPALPQLARELGAQGGTAQMTMAALIMAFGVTLLFWGPVADRFGRRPVLLAGLALYVLASIGCVLAPDIEVLMAARVLQGACMAAAVVGARAMLRDLYEPLEGAQVMALALSGLGVIALLCPVLGGLATSWFGWRGALGLVAVSGVAVLAFVALRLPETIGHRSANAIRLAPMLSDWRGITAHPTFQAWGLLSSCTYSGLYVILAASPFVYMGVLGLSATACGLALASNSAAYITGTFVCRRLVRRHGLVGTVRRAAVLTLLGGGGIVVLAAASVQSVWALLVPQWFFMVAHGIHQPVGHAAVVGPFARQAGTASALAGLLQSLAVFVTGLFLGRALGSSAWPLVGGLGFWAAATGAVALGFVPRAIGSR